MSTVRYTPNGWPYLDEDSLVQDIDNYTQELTDLLEPGLPPKSHTHNADDINTGTLNLARIPNLPASKTNSGTFDLDRIPAIPASKVGSGELDVARIPKLPADHITAGTLNLARIPNLPASRTTSGTFDEARIPDLPADKVTEGTFDLARIPKLPADHIDTGTLDPARLPADPYLIIGEGRPDITGTLTPDIATRVTNAPSGTVFRSTDGPQGAWEWTKRGTTWVLTDGDTGWRDAAALLLNGWTSTNGLRIRRVRDAVYLRAWHPGATERLSGVDATSNDFIQLPLGFRETQGNFGHIGTLGAGDGSEVRSVRKNGSGRFAMTAPIDTTFTGLLTWLTDDAWPTTLTF